MATSTETLLRELTYDSDLKMYTLNGIQPEVNRMISSESRAVGVLFLDLSRVRRLEDNFGWQVYDDFLRTLADLLNDFCDQYAHLKCKASVINRRSDRFLIFFPTTEQAISDEATLEGYERLLKNWLGQHMDKVASLFRMEELPFHLGYAAISEKPLVRFERNLYQGIEEAQQMAEHQEERENIRLLKILRNILQNEQIDTSYQPIVNLPSQEIVGYEALSSNNSTTEFKNTELMFSFANKWGLSTELDRLCRLQAISQTVPWLDQNIRLFLNTNPSVINGSDLDGGQFFKRLEAAHIDPARVVLELTERRAIDHFETFVKHLNQIKKEGIRIAIDDAGAGYASLNSIAELHPDFLKFDMIMVRDIDKFLIKQDLCATILDMSRKIGATMIAEGIETAGELATINEIGVPWGQGFLLGRPTRAEQLLNSDAAAASSADSAST